MGTHTMDIIPLHLGRTLLDHVDGDHDGFSDEDEKTIVAVGQIASSLSLVGSLSIILVILYFRKFNVLHFQLVAMLSVADVIECFAGLLGNPSDPSGLCTFQSIGQQFGGTGSYVWIFVISLTLYLNLMYPGDQVSPEE